MRGIVGAPEAATGLSVKKNENFEFSVFFKSEGSGWSGSGTPKSPVVGDPHIKIINSSCKKLIR